MSFQEKEIPPSIQREILQAATSCTWLGRWKLLIITDKSQRVKVVKAWQEDLRRIGRLKDVDWIESSPRASNHFSGFLASTPESERFTKLGPLSEVLNSRLWSTASDFMGR